MEVEAEKYGQSPHAARARQLCARHLGVLLAHFSNQLAGDESNAVCDGLGDGATV